MWELHWVEMSWEQLSLARQRAELTVVLMDWRSDCLWVLHWVELSWEQLSWEQLSLARQRAELTAVPLVLPMVVPKDWY